MRRLGILGSTQGTDMQAVLTAINHGRLKASIELVISNKAEAPILERARKHRLAALFLNPNDFATSSVYDEHVSSVLKQHRVELVVLIGYMRILSNEFVNQWRDHIINVHPSILPDFAGKMGNQVHQAVLESGVSETGCTVHYVTEEVDAGPILIQKKCPVLPGDTVETLKQRVQQLEGEALIEAINVC